MQQPFVWSWVDPLLFPVGIPINSDDPVIREATEARSRYWAANGKLTELETKKATAQKRLEEDFGSDGAFSALVDKCFEVRAAIHHCVRKVSVLEPSWTRAPR